MLSNAERNRFNIFQNSKLAPVTCIGDIMQPLFVSASDCAEYMVYNLLRAEHRTGTHFVTNKGDEAKKSVYFGKDDVRSKVWDHAVEITRLAKNTEF